MAYTTRRIPTICLNRIPDTKVLIISTIIIGVVYAMFNMTISTESNIPQSIHENVSVGQFLVADRSAEEYDVHRLHGDTSSAIQNDDVVTHTATKKQGRMDEAINQIRNKLLVELKSYDVKFHINDIR
jgi:hypothetical protein